MEGFETISGERNTLLPDTTHGKEEVVIEKLRYSPKTGPGIRVVK